VTPQAQIIAIAEACGWKPDDDGDGTGWKGSWIRQRLIGKKPTFRDGKVVSYLIEQIVPDYLNDLNAMQEAENVLTNEQWWLFVEFLTEIRGGGVAICISATAAQRAEAFLRTLNLWKP
jgi:hypothetical protein